MQTKVILEIPRDRAESLALILKEFCKEVIRNESRKPKDLELLGDASQILCYVNMKLDQTAPRRTPQDPEA